jgi:hypothetical protein
MSGNLEMSLSIADRISRWRDEDPSEETDHFIELLCDAEEELRRMMKDKATFDEVAEAIAKVCGTTTEDLSFNWQLFHAVQSLALERDYHKERLSIALRTEPVKFKRNTPEQMRALPFVESISDESYDGSIVIQWKPVAEQYLWLRQLAHSGLGNCYALDIRRIMQHQQEIEAESWWHLCAILGTEEPAARVLYRIVE